LSFVILLKPLITEGLTYGIAYAATIWAQSLAAAGEESAAILVDASVASAGGLVISAIIGVALFFALIALASVLFRKYYLTVNIYNFDPNHAWTAINYHGDNSEIPNGSWSNETLAKFAPAGSEVTPPGFSPVTTLNGVVTYVSYAFDNDSTFLQGLGIAVAVSRDDSTVGFALKYVIHRFSDNKISLSGNIASPNTFDLESYYNDGWASGSSTSAQAADMTITSSTPALGGASDGAYTFEVSIGAPPPT